MSFATEVVKDGQGVILRLDVSLTADFEGEFGAVDYVFTDVATADQYHGLICLPRIVRMGSLSKGLSEDGSPSQTSFDVTLANADGLLDSWIADWELMLSMRVKLYLGVFTVLDAPGGDANPDITWQALGKYRVASNPRRSSDTITIAFEDSFVTGRTVSPPTIEEWFDSDEETAPGDPPNAVRQCPFRDCTSPELAELQAMDAWTKPLPLSFGFEAAPVIILPRGTEPVDGYGDGAYPPVIQGDYAVWILCATTDAGTITSAASMELWIQQKEPTSDGYELNGNGSSYEVAHSIKHWDEDPDNHAVWVAQKSAAIAKGGVNWYVQYLLIDLNELSVAMRIRNNGMPSVETYVYDATAHLEIRQAVLKDFGNQSHDGYADAEDEEYKGADEIVRMLAAYGLVEPVNETTAEASNAQGAQLYLESETDESIGAALGLTPNAVLERLGRLAQGADMDVCMGWDGQVRLLRTVPTDPASLTGVPHFAEHELSDISDELPSREQRGAFYNRIEMTDVEEWNSPTVLKSNAALSFDWGWIPPTPSSSKVVADSILSELYPNKTVLVADNAYAAPTPSERLVVRRLSAYGNRRGNLSTAPWDYRYVESRGRMRVSFTTGLKALLLDLGDYFTLSWRRGAAQSIYDTQAFQTTSLTLEPDGLTVRVVGLEVDTPA